MARGLRLPSGHAGVVRMQNAIVLYVYLHFLLHSVLLSSPQVRSFTTHIMKSHGRFQERGRRVVMSLALLLMITILTLNVQGFRNPDKQREVVHCRRDHRQRSTHCHLTRDLLRPAHGRQELPSNSEFTTSRYNAHAVQEHPTRKPSRAPDPRWPTNNQCILLVPAFKRNRRDPHSSSPAPRKRHRNSSRHLQRPADRPYWCTLHNH